MRIEFRQALIPAELRSLAAFDRKVFASDHFPPSAWRDYESWWMLLDDRKVGCCAFEKNVDFRDDISPEQGNPPLRGSLYIATTGILPRYQRRGLGRLLKSWQLAYAVQNRFDRIVTNTRRSNKAMIALNMKFGFRILRTTPGYYADPAEATVVMERRLRTSL